MNDIKPAPPEGKKAGSDGLSKKERRALKVQEKVKKGDVCNAKPEIINSSPEAPKSDGKSKKDRRAQRLSDKAKEEPPATKPDATSDNLVSQLNEDNKTSTKPPTEGKTKAQLKAERRELQEKQRLAKEKAKESKPAAVAGKDAAVTPPKPKVVRSNSRKYSLRTRVITSQVQLFNHLHFTQLSPKETGVVCNVHPSFIKLGAQYASKTVLGSNARCLALLSALKDLITDFETPPNQELWRSLESYLQTSVEYLLKCRPIAVSMSNALRYFKMHSAAQVKTSCSDAEKKKHLLHIVDTYIEDEIFTAGTAISNSVNEKIVDGDVILTYGCSSLIRKILLDAKEQNKRFSVIVVDSRPLLEGREMLRKLVSGCGISCSYTLVNAASFIMGRATKVLLGAHALLANGYVMARTGTAQIALIAKAYNKPVLVCCETYKFCERVQTDSFVYNELGSPNFNLPERTGKSDTEKKSKCLTPLSLMYDVTPPDLVTAVVTELGFLPCTSVPVVLRIKPTE